MLNLNKIFINIYLFFFFFPWLRIVQVGDLQPYSFIFGVVLLLGILIKDKLELPQGIILYFFGSIFSILIFLVFKIVDFSSLRALFIYSSIFVHATVIYKVIDLNRFIKILRLASLTYATAGILQLIFGPDIFASFIDIRTTANRGVTSLTPEPTFFGLVMLLMLFIEVIYFKITKKFSKLSFWPALLGIFFISQSSLAILLSIFLLVFFLNLKYLTYGLIAVALPSLIFYVNLGSEENLRLVSLVTLLLSEGPLYLIENDASGNVRIRHIFFPIYGFIDNYFFPHGFNGYIEVSERLVKVFPFFFFGGHSNTIMSGLGAMLFEIGFISFFYLYGFIHSIHKFEYKFAFKIFIFISIFFFMAVPLSLPLFGAMIAVNYKLTYLQKS